MDGSAIPFGYDVENKALVVHAGEAAAIRTIFAEYLAFGSVRQLSAQLDALGVVSKRRTNRHGRVSGGASFSRGALYNILRNPIYIGKVRHKEELYEGLHDAIIDDATWQMAQAQLADHGGKKIRSVRRLAKRLLDGVLFDSKGRAMRTTYANKSVRRDGTPRTKRYWYCATRVPGSKDGTWVERLSADEIERVVLNGLKKRLANTSWLADQIRAHKRNATKVADILQAIERRSVDADKSGDDALVPIFAIIIDRIDAKADRLRISVNLAGMLEPDAADNPTLAAFEIPFQRRQNGRTKPIIITAENAPQQDPGLIALVADARRWVNELLLGKASSVQQITEREGLRSGTVSRILPLARLAPDISRAILEGRQPPQLSSKTLRSLPELPLDWVKQRQILGFAHH
ncbi:recombinase family protein [Falsiphaeobacter marinintestinus]|uniref:recombinase family protein n=1 Tax=Falsiphaeobacter marinintestinus TaxID=1492905 RepID=UPI001FEAF71F|nr:recombinase family protein [Phaeobacter marinintestinus]